MGRYLIQDTTSKAIKKSLKKWGEFPVNNGGLKGVIIINLKERFLLELLMKIDVGMEMKF